MSLVNLSKTLAYALRHRPDAFGLRLDEAGFVSVDVLLAAFAAHGVAIDRAKLEEIVVWNDKARFELDASRTQIRARQGHSVSVELGLLPVVPPEVLHHGTAKRFLEAILRDGLVPSARHAVHLSSDPATARAVGSRHGSPIVLDVDAAAMHRAGHVFHRSENGVYLVASVPPAYLRVRNDAPEGD